MSLNQMVQFECPRAQALKVASLIQFLSWVVPHFPLIALWDNNNWPPSIKVRKSEKFIGQDGLDGLQMVQYECHRHSKLPLSFNS